MWNRDRIECGGIAQLVEHKLCKLGVTGSNPVASTTVRSQIEATNGVLIGSRMGAA